MSNPALTPYTPLLKNWPKSAGNKPTVEALTRIHELGARPGSKASIALAMYLRDTGATQAQVISVTGSPQLNKLRTLVQGGLAKRVNVPNDERGHTVYKVTLTGKKGHPAKEAAPKKQVKAKAKKPDKVEDQPKQEATPA